MAAPHGLDSDLGTVLRRHADTTPDRTILWALDACDAETHLTYGALSARAESIAQQLTARRARGERALVLHPPGLDYVAALFGCFLAGVVAVPAYPPRPGRLAPRLRGLLASSGARFALTTAHELLRIRAHDTTEAELLDLCWLATDEIEPASFRAAPCDPDAIALLQYTSGSTREPRGVMLTHRQFLANIAALCARVPLGPEDRLLSWLPPYHDMGLVGCILLPLCLGVETTLMAPSAFVQRPLRWLEAIARVGATISGAPNFAYELCARRLTPGHLHAGALARWRVAFCGAERVQADTLARFAEATAPFGFRPEALAPCYGLAEATLGVTLGPLGQPLPTQTLSDEALGHGRVRAPRSGERCRRLVGAGAPLEGVQLAIVDPITRARKERDEIGEIWVRSPAVARGYWQAPEVSREAFEAALAEEGEAGPRWLRTGDLGFVFDGALFVTGRLKELLILRGRNFYPEDIEETARTAHAALRSGAGVAFAVEREGGEQLVIVHELDRSARAEIEAVAAAVRSAVADEHGLSVLDVVFVRPGAVPRTSSGKRQRTRARALYLEGALDALATCSAPAPLAPAPDALVDLVASWMAELLGLPAVDPDADFFWLGGHSLLATQLVSRVRARCQVALSLAALFEAATPRKLAARIASAPRTSLSEQVTPWDRSQPLPLSYSQERMWFLHQLDPRGTAYNVAGALCIDGALDVARLGRAFALLMQRHEVLRSRFSSHDGEPVLTLHRDAALPLAFSDLSRCLDPEEAARSAASALAQAPFARSDAPLVRAALYALAPTRHVLAVSMHHLVTDAWSMSILLRDLALLYDALEHGAPLPEPPSLSYVDYAGWQRRALSEESLARSLAYWKQRLAGAEPLRLPLSGPSARRTSAAGAIVPLELPRALVARLGELGRTHGATPFMVLLAAFQVVLHRHSGQRDLLVGVPVANRNHLLAEELVGTLVNTLAVRVELDPAKPFRVLLETVRTRCLEAYEHQDLPFERLVSELGPERRADASPLVQVLFDYQNVPMSARMGALRLAPLTISRGATQFDLSLFLSDSELGGHTGTLEYSTELFSQAAIARFAEHFLEVLGAVLEDPERPVEALPLLSASERAAILEAAGDASPRPPGAPTLARAFAAQVARAPGRVAVRDARGALTFAALERRVEALTRALVSRGVGPGERVALYLERSKELLVAVLSVLRTGAAYVPLDPRHPPARVGYVLEDARPRLLLTEQALAATLPPRPVGLEVLQIEDAREAVPAAREAAPRMEPSPEDAAYVIYTSGSTGRPKGVEVPRRALDNFLESMATEPGLGPDDRVLATTTLAFDIAALELLLPPWVGAEVYVAPSEAVADGERLAALMREVSPTLMQATPATWRMLIEAGFSGLPALTILCGGEALPHDLADALCGIAGRVWNMYGPTETTVWSLCGRVQREGAVTIGTPIAHTRAYVLDGRGALCPLGVAGELWLGGEGVARGYFGRPTLTAERFVADPFGRPGARMYRTGDLARLGFSGRFEHLGRLDHQLKVRGFRIEPGEIEAVLCALDGVREALVIAREDQPGDLRLVAYYVSLGAPQSASALREHLGSRLPEYMIPSAFVALPALPKTPNGKIDRAALPRPEAEHVARTAAPVAPRDALERSLAALFAEILHGASPGIRDSFFALGGHSLLAVRLFARIRREHGVDLPLATLFEGPTVEHLAARIREASARAGTAPAPAWAYLVPLVPEGSETALFCVHGAGGHVIGLMPLARQVARGRPVYGLEARGVDGVSEPFATIEEAARAYLAEVRRLQPHGPYLLAGYCGGGTVAFEMARLLRAAGERVALLALIDTYRPGIRVHRDRAARLARIGSARGARGLAEHALARLGERLSLAAQRLVVAGHRALSRPVPHTLRDLWLTLAFFRAAARYRPGPYAGDVVILRAQQIDASLRTVGPELGWSGFVHGKIEVHDVPGTHTTLLDAPHVQVLAARLLGLLANADAAPPEPAPAQRARR